MSFIVLGCLESLQATERILAGRDNKRMDLQIMERRLMTLCMYAGSARCILPEGKGCY